MQRISCTEPLSPAWLRMKIQLFKPFDLGAWFALGFTAWLAALGESGISFNLGTRSESRSAIGEFVRHHLPLVITGAALVALLVVAILVALMWVRARGQFMFLDNVVLQRSAVADPWRRFESHGNSAFRWTLGYVLVAILLLGIVFGVLALSIGLHALGNQMAIPLTAIAFCALVFLLSVSLLFAWMLFHDFALILMYRHGLAASAAWGEVLDLFRAHCGDFILYALVKFVVALGLGIAYLVAGVLTCCCGLVLLATPYIGAVVSLPYSVFLRQYANEWFRQFGPRYDVFHVEEPPVVPPAPTPPPMPPDVPRADEPPALGFS